MGRSRVHVKNVPQRHNISFFFFLAFGRYIFRKDEKCHKNAHKLQDIKIIIVFSIKDSIVSIAPTKLTNRGCEDLMAFFLRIHATTKLTGNVNATFPNCFWNALIFPELNT